MIWVLLMLCCGLLCSPKVNAQIIIDGNTSDWDAMHANSDDYPTYGHVQDLYGNGVVDNQFAEGQKDIIPAENWKWSLSQTKGKNDIANGAVVIIDGKVYFAGDRSKVVGAAQIGFWVFLDGTSPQPLDNKGKGTFSPAHNVSPGDILILADFSGGGRYATITVYQWVGSGGNAEDPQFNLLTTDANVAQNNSGSVPVPAGWGYGSASYETNAFYEGYVDLSTIIGNTNLSTICDSYFLLETRSSPSLTASLDDFVGGTFITTPSLQSTTLSICNNQETVELCVADLPGTKYEWFLDSLLQHKLTLDTTACVEISISGLPAVNTFYVTANNGYCTSTKTKSILNIHTVVLVCPLTKDEVSCQTQAEINAKFDTWLASATVVGTNLEIQNDWGGTYPSACGGSITVNFWVGGDCPQNCSSTFTVESDTEAPVIAALGDYTLEGCNTDWPATLSTSWSDNCDGENQSITSDGGVDGASEGCLQSRVYTFNVMDACGNPATSQTTVWRQYDMTAPQIVGVDDYTLCDEDAPMMIIAQWTDNCSDGGDVTAHSQVYSTTACDTIYSYTFDVMDECGNSASKTIYVTKSTTKYDNCETAIAKLDGDYGSDARCFIEDGFNRWGWTNLIREEGTYTLPLYAGAAQCNTNKGALVGNVIVDYSGGMVSVEYQIFEGFVMSEAHIYIGCEPYPTMKNGKQTVAPGQFTFNGGMLEHVNGLRAEFNSVSGSFYIIAHAVTCGVVCSCGSEVPIVAGGYETMYLGIDCMMDEVVTIPEEKATDSSMLKTGVKAYPNPFSKMVQFEFTPTEDGLATIEIYDMLGSLKAVVYKNQVKAGAQYNAKFDGSDYAGGMYTYRFILNNQIIKGVIVKGK